MAIVDDATIELVSSVGAELLQEDVVKTLGDEAALEKLRATISEAAVPEIEIVMAAPGYVGPGGRLHYTGPDGFVEAWRDWLEAYESYTLEIDDIVEGTEGRVLMLARQRGRTRIGGVELEESAGAVWTVRDGKLARMEFHLDPEAARRAAGIAD